MEQAHTLDWKVGLHVVGDAAMEMVLQAFHRVNTHSRTYDRGHTLEHAFSPVPGALVRTRDLGIGVTLHHALVYILAGNMHSYWGQLRAGALLGSIPVAFVYSFFVEHYVSGITGSVKG